MLLVYFTAFSISPKPFLHALLYETHETSAHTGMLYLEHGVNVMQKW